MQNGVRRDFGNGTDVALRRFRTQSELRADSIAAGGTWGKLPACMRGRRSLPTPLRNVCKSVCKIEC